MSPGCGEFTDTTLTRDARGYPDYFRSETGCLRAAAGASAGDGAATIDKDARARWSSWERPEWISFTPGPLSGQPPG